LRVRKTRFRDRYPDTGESGEAYDLERDYSIYLSRRRFWLWSFGLEMGLASMVILALTLVLQPVMVVEPNNFVRYSELFVLSLGIAAISSILVTKRTGPKN
jgi:hypothetical protein